MRFLSLSLLSLQPLECSPHLFGRCYWFIHVNWPSCVGLFLFWYELDCLHKYVRVLLLQSYTKFYFKWILHVCISLLVYNTEISFVHMDLVLWTPTYFSIYYFLLYLFSGSFHAFVHLSVCVCHGMHVGAREQTVGVSSVFPLQGFLWSNSGHQTYTQVPFPSEPSCQSGLIF